MTLHATRDPRDPRQVTVHATYGPARYEITEDAGHLRAFWSQLGRLLDEAEGKDPGQRAYERYLEHSGGKSIASGYELPAWEGNEQKYRDAWEHAAG